MAVYLFIFGLLTGIALLMEAPLTRRARLTLIWSGYIILVLFVGLRWQTGNDWFNYYNYYMHVDSLGDEAQSFEIGYRLVNLAFRSLGLPYTVFLLIYSAVYLALFILSFDDDDFRMGGWLLLLMYSSFLIGWMGTSRQIMAIAICVFSKRYLTSKQWTNFLLCIALAACFHTTAIIFLLAWPLDRMQIKLNHTWVILALLAVAAAFNVGEVLIQLAGGYLGIPYLARMLSLYANPEDPYSISEKLSILFYVKRLAFLLFFILGFRFFRTERDRLYFKLYLISVAVFVLFYGAIPLIPLRAGMYFAITELFLFALLARRIQSRAGRSLYCAALVILCLLRMCTGIYNYPKIFVPYKGVVINRDVSRDEGWF